MNGRIQKLAVVAVAALLAAMENAAPENGRCSTTNFNAAATGFFPADAPEYAVAIGFGGLPWQRGLEEYMLPGLSRVVMNLCDMKN